MSMTLNSFSRPRTKSKNTQLHDLCSVFISAVEESDIYIGLIGQHYGMSVFSL